MPRAPQGLGPGEVFRSVDSNSSVMRESAADPHAGLQGPQLLEAFRPFERGRRQRGDPEQRLAAIAVESEMRETRSIGWYAPQLGSAIERDVGAGEVERIAVRGPDHLHHVR